MSYALFFAPAALVVAVLTLMVVPFLSLIVLMIGLIAIAAAAVAVAVKGVAAPFQLARSNRRHRRARTAATQLNAGQPAVRAVVGDSERSLSCS